MIIIIISSSNIITLSFQFKGHPKAWVYTNIIYIYICIYVCTYLPVYIYIYIYIYIQGHPKAWVPTTLQVHIDLI